MVQALLDLLAPRRCPACDAPTLGCCSLRTPGLEVPAPPGVNVAWCAGVYADELQTAIQRFKYGRRPDLAPQLARCLLPGAERLARATTLIVPVPLHPVRLAERGFDQSALLARRIAAVLGLRAGVRALRRTRHSASQAGRTRLDRQRAVRGLYESAGELSEVGHVLLVDDVLTTGSTLSACASALRGAGVRHVDALVLAAARDEPARVRHNR